MNKLINILIACFILSGAAEASATDGSIVRFFSPQKAPDAHEVVARLYPSQTDSQRRVAVLVAERAGAVLGKEWSETAVVIAYKESRFNCKATGPLAKGSRAMGVMQVMPGTARGMGFNPRHLHDCRYGIDAGVEHMRRCLDAGAANQKQMIRCHQTGWAHKKTRPHKGSRAVRESSNRSN
jgi:hypothetical protein